MRGGIAIPLSSAALAFQLSGWWTGNRLFGTANSEAMLFTFLVAVLGITGWMCWTMDESSRFPTWTDRIAWGSMFALGFAIGLLMRFGS